MDLLWIKTNPIIKNIFSNYVWTIANDKKKVFLTFDDGPTPEITEWVLAQLKKYNFKATFFCIGNNIEKHPDLFNQLITEGHAIGNHTFNHVKGWNTPNKTYLKEVEKCEEMIEHYSINQNLSKLFRPPYGKIKPLQSRKLRKLGYKIIMWDVLSADYKRTITKEKCLENVVKNVESGSIIVFHDSIKAFPNLEFVLPKTLQFLSENGYQCEIIN
ncbi:MAG TPA: polysaccharide deacetylase family protein [Flavobacterium sp.]|uniref:polysaccharide deacetylase family protein n=1 Tax=unclassified Flavobacterium TaxID=196869 RepID=UPI000E9899BB|nr:MULTISPECIES: polysaccharide deacetylase family protein [unclassified Flavobacterium]HBI01090.1 polysaccharide deacetylase family protein [Flavobacterium sp.]HRE76244.1 polysaccharide deacetylase family protein [Flavobacterium sp.]